MHENEHGHGQAPAPDTLEEHGVEAPVEDETSEEREVKPDSLEEH